MSRREIVGCDRCKKEAETPDEQRALDLHDVILGTSRRFVGQYETSRVPAYAAHTEWQKVWCLTCRKETGLAVVEEKRYSTPPAEVPELEAMVREIIRQEIRAATGA
jgi:hypothetical protein